MLKQEALRTYDRLEEPEKVLGSESKFKFILQSQNLAANKYLIVTSVNILENNSTYKDRRQFLT